MILKDSILASLGKYCGGECQERKTYLNLCSYLVAIFVYEKGCFTMKKWEPGITGLKFISENILVAPIKAWGLQPLTSAAPVSCFQMVAKLVQCKYGPEGITWVNRTAGLGSEAAGGRSLQRSGP